MQIAIDCAGFSPAKADKLRRAMATFRRAGTIHKLKDDFINGMLANKYEQEFAERCFKQIEGFGEYGFPESHAASFAILVYVSSWVKYHYPEVFCAALLNSQPMGFYAPAQLVRDAREHNVEVRPPDINASDWDSTLEKTLGEHCALRLGFHQVNGLKKDDMKRFVERRADDPIAIRPICGGAAASPSGRSWRWRAPMPSPRWACRGVTCCGRCAPSPRCRCRCSMAGAHHRTGSHPAQAHARRADRRRLLDHLDVAARPSAGAAAADAVGAAHVELEEAAREARNGDFLQMAGLVLVRQRPGTASGVVFVTLEDEFGIANLVVWPKVFEAYRRIVMGSRLLGVAGKVQRVDSTDDIGASVIHLVAERLWDWSADLDRIADLDGRFELRLGRGDQAHSSTPDPRDEPGKGKKPYDRSRIIFDRPQIKIASHDFH